MLIKHRLRFPSLLILIYPYMIYYGIKKMRPNIKNMYSPNKSKFNDLSFATQHAMPPKFDGKWETECLNTKFPLVTLLCAGYSVMLI